jgi:hydrogenase expression/formation protein HypD
MVVDACLNDIRRLSGQVGRPVKFMEVCGTHTMAAFRTGLRSLLPTDVSLISGPGCPVCVTPDAYLDRAIAIAGQPDTILTTFGDMLRVPGSESSLEHTRAKGADVRVVYSPMDALAMAEANPEKRVVFLGVGFETTTPTVAWTVRAAAEKKIANYSVLCAHKTIPEAMSALLEGGDIGIDGFLCPGHVSVITGSRVYEPACDTYRVPCVVAGFEAADMARAIRMLLKQVVDNRGEVEIEYTRSVDHDGNETAQELCGTVFEKCDAEWRGLGVIPGSGQKIRELFGAHDADRVFANVPVPASGTRSKDAARCICGDVLRGVKRPGDCPLFAARCTPSTPVGPCMVSSEGTCAAYYKYGKKQKARNQS